MEEFQEAEILWPDDDSHDWVTGEEASGAAAVLRPSYTSSTPIRIPSQAPIQCFHSKMHSKYDDGDGDGDGDGDVIPPHLVMSQRDEEKTGSSVCAGRGRTLKGRDLTRLRNYVLRMTGFLEP